MPADTSTARKTEPMPSEPVRTYRLSDELYEAAQEIVYERRYRPGVAGVAQLALRAYVADPDAFYRACWQIIGEEA